MNETPPVFTNPNPPQVGDGQLTNAFKPGTLPAEACYLGWQESLVLFGKLVEADIPG